MKPSHSLIYYLKHVPLNENIADAPSRGLSEIDFSLSEEVWV